MKRLQIKDAIWDFDAILSYSVALWGIDLAEKCRLAGEEWAKSFGVAPYES